jgi:hypothetical protein
MPSCPSDCFFHAVEVRLVLFFSICHQPLKSRPCQGCNWLGQTVFITLGILTWLPLPGSCSFVTDFSRTWEMRLACVSIL